MSDDLKQLKERIYQNGHIEKVLEELGCDKDDIKYEQHGNLIVAPHPNGWNKRAVQIKNNPSLTSYIRNEGIEGDIFAIIGFFLYETTTFDEVKSKLYQIKQWIVNALEYDDFTFGDFENPKPKTDWNWWLRPIQQARVKEVEVTENEVLDEKILNQYIHYPYYEWYKDGISIDTQIEYGIALDVQSERVVIPIRNKNGELIGVKGRYIGKDKEMMDNKKYNYLYRCSKSIELFNLHRALPYIQEKKECIILEGGKSTMILHSWDIKNAVSIDGDKISPVQVKLIKELGLDIDLIIGFDRDKDESYIHKQIKQIKNRRVFYLYDEEDLLTDPKASPVDNGYETWCKLYEKKKRFI